ncbi:cardiolipin synthase [Weissella koreensis]|uniref:Cardiolipin synthase n=1 Tax=Weissella koreensis TaxID=165096 RepID=A0A7H1MN16_9LACO|nr:cardiolipin synthase [Weissella koreensis]AEJ24034.1 cardiolipin synthetase 2 [Weissella koreensis KACC 15510]AVH75648.1 cardiolipin synthase [Weissella koreensis]EJF34635.1 cardiolipin synthetase [Weissella koreensis KCTC 3621]QGN20871.1 cardiolipin synthase [Weissella koreensis]QNT64852.1 cardiolipin synthase [Weissella koreensis]
MPFLYLHINVFADIVVLLNTIAAIAIVFRGEREVSSMWAWLMVLITLPGIGLIIYMFLGRNLNSKKIFSLQTQKVLGIDKIVKNQKKLAHEIDTAEHLEEEGSFVRLFLQNDAALLTFQNSVHIFTDGHDKFDQLFADIKKAKHHINLEYFTIYDDEIGNQLVDLLTQRAQAGVRVRVLFDQWGSKGRHDKMWRRLRDAGGQVVPFLSPRYVAITFRINFRDHRKIAVIDGSIGYIGGFNVGDQYLGRFKKFGHWRDTHVRIEGDAVLAIQSRFFTDWNATTKKQQLNFSDDYFPSQQASNNRTTAIQIVSSGPDDTKKQIQTGYLKMFASATESIYIQTPYFIPDQAVLEVLRMAVLSGVKVKIMIPAFPDHPFVYRATEWYVKQLIQVGAEIYRYDKGFMHAKTVTIDGRISSIGSANMDIRSFILNFEANAFMYDRNLAKQLENIYHADILESTKLDLAYFEHQSVWKKALQRMSRLLGPIL